MTRRYLLAILLALSSAAACKAKSQDKKAAPAQPSETDTSAPKPLTPEEEQAITKSFITRFVDVIEADDVSRWPEVITKERAAEYTRDGVMDKVYAAWRRSSATVSDKLRKAPFRLEKSEGTMTLHFEGVIIANDPDKGYSMAVRIDDGKMYVDEN